MPPKPLFRYIAGGAPRDDSAVTVVIDGKAVAMSAASSVAAGLLAAGITATRVSPVSGAPRAAYCMMGVCFECLVEVDGKPNQQACLITPEQGMQVRTLQSAPSPAPARDGRNA